MSGDQFEFSQFTQRVCSAADDVINPDMTVGQANAALAELARFIIDENGGAPLLLHLHPALMETSVSMNWIQRPTALGRDVVDGVALQALLEVMEPVRRETFLRAFEDGIAAAVDRIFDFVIEARPHVRGVVSEEDARILGEIRGAIANGNISQPGLAHGLMLANAILSKLAILDERSRIATTLGGVDLIRGHADSVDKLLEARMTDLDGFFQIFIEANAERIASAPSAR